MRPPAGGSLPPPHPPPPFFSSQGRTYRMPPSFQPLPPSENFDLSTRPVSALRLTSLGACSWVTSQSLLPLLSQYSDVPHKTRSHSLSPTQDPALETLLSSRFSSRASALQDSPPKTLLPQDSTSVPSASGSPRGISSPSGLSPQDLPPLRSLLSSGLSSHSGHSSPQVSPPLRSLLPLRSLISSGLSSPQVTHLLRSPGLSSPQVSLP